jgi:hypothetical protein
LPAKDEPAPATHHELFERNRTHATRHKMRESDFLFTGKSGQPLTASAVSSM